MRWRLTWLTVVLMALVSRPLLSQEGTRDNQANLKWAQGVAKEFLDAVGSGEFELADSLVSDSFRAALTKQKKDGLRVWLSKNAGTKSLAKREIRAAEISPDGNEVAISGQGRADDSTLYSFSLRLVKDQKSNEWEVRYFNVSADSTTVDGPSARPAMAIKKPEPTPKIVKPHERLLGDIPADFVVSAFAMHESSKLADVQITNNSNATGIADVVVNQPKKNVVLLLAAYDPTIWRISRTPETHIVGVVVTGYHDQAVLGIDSNIKRAISTHDTPGGFTYYSDNYGSDPSYEKYFSRFAQITLGKAASSFGQQRTGGLIGIGEEPPEDAKLVTSTAKKLQDLAVEGSLPPGEKGLALLVKEGKLRPATQDDIEEWRELAFQRNTKSTGRPGPYLNADRSYVFLKETPLPPGLYGGNARSFLVPKGFSIDRGSQQHCSFYLMDGTQQGAGAPR